MSFLSAEYDERAKYHPCDRSYQEREVVITFLDHGVNTNSVHQDRPLFAYGALTLAWAFTRLTKSALAWHALTNEACSTLAFKGPIWTIAVTIVIKEDWLVSSKSVSETGRTLGVRRGETGLTRSRALKVQREGVFSAVDHEVVVSERSNLERTRFHVIRRVCVVADTELDSFRLEVTGIKRLANPDRVEDVRVLTVNGVVDPEGLRGAPDLFRFDFLRKPHLQVHALDVSLWSKRHKVLRHRTVLV